MFWYQPNRKRPGDSLHDLRTKQRKYDRIHGYWHSGFLKLLVRWRQRRWRPRRLGTQLSWAPDQIGQRSCRGRGDSSVQILPLLAKSVLHPPSSVNYLIWLAVVCVCVCMCVCVWERECCVCDVGRICWCTVHGWISLLLLLYCSSLFSFLFCTARQTLVGLEVRA